MLKAEPHVMSLRATGEFVKESLDLVNELMG